MDIKQNPFGFEALIDGERAGFIEVIPAKGGQVLILPHTETLPKFEGQGVGSSLVLAAFALAHKGYAGIDPECPFVRAYIKRHPESIEGLKIFHLSEVEGDPVAALDSWR